MNKKYYFKAKRPQIIRGRRSQNQALKLNKKIPIAFLWKLAYLLYTIS